MQFRSRLAATVVAAALQGACAGSSQPAPPPATPAAPQSPAAQGPSAPRDLLPPSPAGVPEAPPTCQAFAAPPAPKPCDDAQALPALDRALQIEAPEARDTELSALESCPSFPAGLMRALRAELLPAACADVIVGALPASERERLSPEVRDVLIGLGLGARLTRLAAAPPRPSLPIDKRRFQEFLRDRLAPWMQLQAHAIHQTALSGAALDGYGRAIAAVESGLADMRFVQVVRDVPLPQELDDDAELRDTYFATLDEVLEPRKGRGRDAALVGLRGFAAQGAIADPRVERARRLLTALYSGSLVDALDGLILDDLPPAPTATLEQRLAARLPVFYSGLLLQGQDARDAGLLRALLERGVPAPLEDRLRNAPLSPAAAHSYGRFLVELGRTYWLAERFVQARSVLAPLADVPAAALTSAVAAALANGPESATALMARGPLAAGANVSTTALDALVTERHPLAGAAAFNAAYLLSALPREDADAAHWSRIAARFRAAAELLDAPDRKRDALDRAHAADQTAKALSSPAPSKAP